MTQDTCPTGAPDAKAPLTAAVGVDERGQEASDASGSHHGAPFDFGNLARLEPVSRQFGLDRGQAIDRVFIERFLERHRRDIRGRVMEVAEDTYTRRFGCRVSVSDILHLDPAYRKATITGDLTRTNDWRAGTHDCIILTQTLQHVFDVAAAVRTVHRVLAPGGVVLVTVPGISQISRFDMERWGDFWRFTTRSVQELFERVFAPRDVQIKSYGNVWCSAAFLHGLSAAEIPPEALVRHDPDYQLVITVRAVKTQG